LTTGLSGRVQVARPSAGLVTVGGGAATWTEYLIDKIDPNWRAGEWDQQTWIFVPDPNNPNTRLRRCARPSCGVRCDMEFCTTCTRERKDNAWTEAQLRVTPRSTPIVTARSKRGARCRVVRAGQQCQREEAWFGVCYTHYYRWKNNHRGRATVEELDLYLRGEPFAPLASMAECAIPGCPHMSAREVRPACHWHSTEYINRARKVRGLTFESFVERFAEPPLPAFSLPLVVLPEPLRPELLYGMQSYDEERGLQWSAQTWRVLFCRIREGNLHTLVGADAPALVGKSICGALMRHAVAVVDSAHRAFRGHDDPDVLNPRTVGVAYRAMRAHNRLDHRSGPIDLRKVSQTWLREALRSWITVTKPYLEDIRSTILAVQHASETLRSTRRDSGDSLELLDQSDMKAIVKGINEKWKGSRKTQENKLAGWWKIVAHARAHGLWEKSKDSFNRNVEEHRATAPRSGSEEEPGQALPTAVVQHLTRHLDLLVEAAANDPRDRFGGPRLRAACYRAMLIVLRDTGRRPGEVVTLCHDCLGQDDDRTWYLIWDNHKGKRLKRRLPIHSDTAEAIHRWREFKATTSVGESKWLFPSPIGIDRPITAETLSTALKVWKTVTPPITSKVLDVDGEWVNFDIATITPYDFRHTYAQRHADAEVAPDTLRELMDHRAIKTTMVYYRVNWKRKKEAVRRIAPLSIDREGNQVGLSVQRYALASVVVPFGGCTEPTNVKAGGTACPIRFQCASCDFYRPDPSFLPDIERLIAELRVNLAQARAMGSPSYVVNGFEGQLADYSKVVEAMKRQLDALPPTERAEIEAAATVLRRARQAEAAGASLPITPLEAESVNRPETETEP
jgi:integrase